MSSGNNLKQLKSEAKEIANRACSLRQLPNGAHGDVVELTEQLPSLRLAHYSSLEAIVSMLQSLGDGLRLSDSSKMNDPEEGCATSDGRKILGSLKEKFGKNSWPWKRYSSAHICCFVGIRKRENQVIDAGDDLLFWRLYGNECRGVSLTVAEHKSKELVDSSVIQRVIYNNDPPNQADIPSILNLLSDLDNLRNRACEADCWSEIYKYVLPECDHLMGQRFLQKRSHYEMECEYRAVAFVTQDNVEGSENFKISSHGRHVQYGLIRTYVQIPEFDRKSIFTTGTQITIGSNVPKSKNAIKFLKILLESISGAPSVISTRVSEIGYRPR